MVTPLILAASFSTHENVSLTLTRAFGTHLSASLSINT